LASLFGEPTVNEAGGVEDGIIEGKMLGSLTPADVVGVEVVSFSLVEEGLAMPEQKDIGGVFGGVLHIISEVQARRGVRGEFWGVILEGWLI
jgi:hypothetical protein